MSPAAATHAATRAARVAGRVRNARWTLPPVRVEMAYCISCDACIRACPPQFGAVFHQGSDVVIVPELCSGCGKCLAPVCPADCIVADPAARPTPDPWWSHPYGPEDPYVR